MHSSVILTFIMSFFSCRSLLSFCQQLEKQQDPGSMCCCTRFQLEWWLEGHLINAQTVNVAKGTVSWSYVITTITYDGTPYLYTHRLTAVLDDQVTMGPRRSLQINSSEFEVPTQEDNVMCGVLVTCPHQVVSEMTQYPQ